jgi:2-succinyl-5-enolpyruvyl-6-hydroxy-3-cyclohexene-1-carboxylate synthase
MDVGSLNEQMTALLVEHLVAHGIERFCLSPGSRSTALALAISKAKVRCDTHFDERALGFYALGCAKGSGKPVALLVTSGTAVGNLMPAVMEASNDHVPLILITADRPQELRDCSANQTCDQVKLFASYVRWQGDLPLSDPQFPPSSLAAAIGQALFLCQKPKPGPVHLNCMLREPFFSAYPSPALPITLRQCDSGELIPTQESISYWIQRLTQCKRGLIVVGSMTHRIDAIFQLAEKLGWPIYADILSQMRTHSHPHLISHFDLLVQIGQHEPIEAVLQFGQRITSKNVSEWLKKQSLQFYLHISDFPTLADPHHLVTHRLHASSAHIAHMLAYHTPRDPDPEWCTTWKERDTAVSEQLDHIFSQDLDLSEPAVIRSIATSIAPDTGLFLANSMPIRDADKFFPTLPHPLTVYANRGVSGIDGNIATALGIAQGMRKPLIALLGDLAFLHDLNALALLVKSEYPLCLIVINNGGGGIFSFLPIQEKKEPFEKFFACAHNLTFSSAAALFDIPYAQPQTPAELSNCIHSKKTILVEICTNRSENCALHDRIIAAIRKKQLTISNCTS